MFYCLTTYSLKSEGKNYFCSEFKTLNFGFLPNPFNNLVFIIALWLLGDDKKNGKQLLTILIRKFNFSKNIILI